jgi:hypothetical protein
MQRAGKRQRDLVPKTGLATDWLLIAIAKQASATE